MDIVVKIPVQRLNNEAKLPNNAYDGDAGFDLCSCINCNLKPGERKLIPCGFSLELPGDFAALVVPRSGLAINHGITVLNSPGLIDSGYRGEVCVILVNTDNSKCFKISVGDRIAQLLIINYKKVEFIIVDKLKDSKRSIKGFGSSGTK